MTPVYARSTNSIERDPTRRRKPFRVTLVCALIAIGSFGGFAGNNAAADTLNPLQDAGGPGGNGGSAIVLLSADTRSFSDSTSEGRSTHCPPCPTP